MSKQKFSIKHTLFAIALAIVCIFSASASAQTSTASSSNGQGSLTSLPTMTPASSVSTNNVSFAVSNTDISLGLLQGILGDWTQTTADTTIGSLFSSFNLIVLVFAAALFMYVSIAGTLHSAEDGEVLGKQWGSWFVPIRMAGGFAMLFPLANGFSTVQIIVLWLATNGIGAANWATNQTIAGFINGEGYSLAQQSISGSKLVDTMTGIMQAELCVAERNRGATGDPTQGPYGLPGPYIQNANTSTSTVSSTGLNNSYNKISWGVNPNYSGSQVPAGLSGDAAVDLCGSITIPNYNSVLGVGNGNGSLSNLSSNVYALVSTVSFGWDLNSANTAVRNAHAQAITAAAASLRPYAQQFAAGTYADSTSPTTLATAIANAALAYKSSMASQLTASALPNMQSMNTAMQQNVNTNGWASLGTFFYQYARISTEMSKMVHYAPTIDPPRSASGSDNDSTASNSETEIMQALNAAIVQSASSNATATQLQSAGQAQGGAVGGAVAASNTVFNGASAFLGQTFGVDPTNPKHAVLQLKDVGDNILSAAELIMVASTAFDVAKKVTPAGAVTSAASGVLQKVGVEALIGSIFKSSTAKASAEIVKYICMFAIIGLLGFAVTLAFWLPMAPFVLWLGGVMGWAIAVLEMVVAAPLWAAAHIHPAGEGAASQYGKSGYMIIVEVFAKPVLMVAGFFIACKFSHWFLIFSSQLFFNSMTTVNADSVTGIVTTLCFVFMYVMFCVSIVNRTFSLIHVLPASVLRWIGATNRDDFAQSERLANDLNTTSERANRAAQGAIKDGGLASLGVSASKKTLHSEAESEIRRASKDNQVD